MRYEKINAVSFLVLLEEQVVEPARKQALVTHLDCGLEGASVRAGSLM